MQDLEACDTVASHNLVDLANGTIRTCYSKVALYSSFNMNNQPGHKCLVSGV